MATNIMLKTKYNIANIKFDELEYVAIKVPVFLFQDYLT